MPDPAILEKLRENLAHVEHRLRTACARAGRSRQEVTLVAVTKTVSADVARLLPGLGVPDLGESRPQELWRKAAALADVEGVRWHQVGHLQRNKLERTLPLLHRIHSLDSRRLLDAVEKGAGRLGRVIPAFLEVNASGEQAKHGFAPAEVQGLAPVLAGLQHVRVLGLMTMAAWDEDPEKTRPTFALLRGLRDRLKADVGEAHPLDELSMGMSNDFEVAIGEGATAVRIGSVLFEGIAG